MPRNNIHRGLNYMGHPLMESAHFRPVWRINILEPLLTRLHFMTALYDNVIVFRLDIRLPDRYLSWYEPNGFFSKFVEYFSQRLSMRMGLQFIWVREKKRGTAFPHWHLLIIADADRVRNNNPWPAMLLANEIWERVLQVPEGSGLVHLCMEDGAEEDVRDTAVFDSHSCNYAYADPEPVKRVKTIVIHKGDNNAALLFDEAVRWSSYIAKHYSCKGNKPYRVREVGYSALPSRDSVLPLDECS